MSSLNRNLFWKYLQNWPLLRKPKAFSSILQHPWRGLNLYCGDGSYSCALNTLNAIFGSARNRRPGADFRISSRSLPFNILPRGLTNRLVLETLGVDPRLPGYNVIQRCPIMKSSRLALLALPAYRVQGGKVLWLTQMESQTHLGRNTISGGLNVQKWGRCT